MADDFFNAAVKSVKTAPSAGGHPPKTAVRTNQPIQRKNPHGSPLGAGVGSSLNAGRLTPGIKKGDDMRTSIRSRLSVAGKPQLVELKSWLEDPICEEFVESFDEYVEGRDFSAIETAMIFGDVFGIPKYRRRKL
ncbi:MAG: hypothetical protein LBC13_03885 [Clostridiales bacterium]|jgi:hypothetical protein|nr:hypothetical protein [Clostridiales bacterium]